jgi:hypothetical protein
MKSGDLNFLQSSGPLQACNGTSLPLPFTLHVSNDNLKSSTRFQTDNGGCHITHGSVNQFKVVGFLKRLWSSLMR